MTLNVLELYSGIGGMHFALEALGIDYKVVLAIDINHICNEIYSLNFPNTNVVGKCLTSFTEKDFDKINANMILMSPPCQPFTINGNQNDIHDNRTSSLKHFLSILPKFKNIPNFFLIENVKGFEFSEMRNLLYSTLTNLEFILQEFLLCPTQINYPNSRTRYYLLAKQKPSSFSFERCSEIQVNLPELILDANTPFIFKNYFETKKQKNSHFLLNNDTSKPITIECFLEKKNDKYFEKFSFPIKLYKKFWLMDLVSKDSVKTCCFTKGYGKFIEKSGSIFQKSEAKKDLWSLKYHEDSEEFITEIRKLGLRFFTPKEIANLLGFPSNFNLPEQLTPIQSYRAIGNSINVQLVAYLIYLLIS